MATALGGCFLSAPMVGPTPVTDVSSDLENPPVFKALALPRIEDGYPAAYPDGEAAVMQEFSYPEIKPLSSSLPPRMAFDRALGLVREKGWEVVAAVPPAPGRSPGRIEAQAKPTLISKPDDVIIRLAAAKDGTIIDMRSAARHDRRDLGVNARRVSDFLYELRDVLLSSR